MPTWDEWAFDTSKTVPAHLVSRDYRAINNQVDGSFGQGTYKNGEVTELNPLDVYPVVRVSDEHGSTDIPDDTVESYAPQDGGFVYEIRQTFTAAPPPIPPDLDDVKAAAFTVADENALALVNGGFFYDDGAGDDLFNSDPETRSFLAQIGLEAVYVGNAFTVDIRDANSVKHTFNKDNWTDFYHAFYLLLTQAQAELETANLAIIAASDEAEVQAALDAMSPPNNTL